jgi:hypothetical protein
MEMGPAGTYQVFGVGEVALGGMMTKPPEMQMPSNWLYYVETSDLDAAIARSTKRGAKVLNGPMDIPGGRIAQLMDPQGAAYALHEGPKKLSAEQSRIEWARIFGCGPFFVLWRLEPKWHHPLAGRTLVCNPTTRGGGVRWTMRVSETLWMHIEETSSMRCEFIWA